MLVESGADVNLLDDLQENSAMKCVIGQHGKEELILNYLIEKGINLNWKGNVKKFIFNLFIF